MPRTVPKKDRFFGLFEKLRQPDITGGFGDVVWTRTVRGAHIVGATTSQSVNRNVTNEGSEYVGWVDFQASKSASIYGGSTVQPASVRLMPIIKA